MSDDEFKRRLGGFPLDEHKDAEGHQPAINWGALLVILLTIGIAYFVFFPILNWFIRLL